MPTLNSGHLDAQTPLWSGNHHTYPSIPATLIEDFLLAHHILGTHGFDVSTRGRDKAGEGGRSSEGHSKQTGLGAKMGGSSLAPAVLHTQSFQVSLLLRTPPWLSVAPWIKSKLLSLALEDKVLTLSSQHHVLTSATNFLRL